MSRASPSHDLCPYGINLLEAIAALTKGQLYTLVLPYLAVERVPGLRIPSGTFITHGAGN